MGICSCVKQNEKEYEFDTLNYSNIALNNILKKFAKDPKIFKTLIRAQAKWKGIILRNKIKVLKSGKKKPYLKLNIKSEISEYSDITKNSINNQEKLKSAKPNKQVNIGTPLSNQNQILFSSNSNKINNLDLINTFIKYPPLKYDNKKIEKRPLIEYSNGGYYLGEWDIETNNKHGRGIYVYPEGSKYEGYFLNDHANNLGKLTHKNGDYYEGYFKDDMADGEGKYYHKNGNIYIGNWKENKLNGQGKEIWLDKSEYNGEFKNGVKNGKGVFKWSNGDYYEGNFENDKMNGKGMFKWADGRIYDGEWVDNKMEGFGKFTWPDGKYYIGEYKDDKKEGFGELYWKNGWIYKGNWKNGKQNGEGEFFDKIWKKGIWNEGNVVKYY